MLSSSKSFFIKDILSNNHQAISFDDNNETENILLSKPIDLQYQLNDMYFLYSLLLSNSTYSIENSPLNLFIQMNKHRINQSNTTNNVFDRTISIEDLPKRKRRKCRTAFTTYQLYGLEKHFTLQKYLTSYERDQIACELQLSPAQVITWFQNRRAKSKRDCDELKNDINLTRKKMQKTKEIIDFI